MPLHFVAQTQQQIYCGSDRRLLLASLAAGAAQVMAAIPFHRGPACSSIGGSGQCSDAQTVRSSSASATLSGRRG